MTERQEKIQFYYSLLEKGQQKPIQGTDMTFTVQNEQSKETLWKKATFLYLYETSFSIASACRKNRMSRTTYYGWYEDDPLFKDLFDLLDESKIDFFEDALFTAIRNKAPGYTRLIEFALKTIGKKRGYTEKVTSYEDDVIEFTLKVGKKKLQPPPLPPTP